MTKSIDLKSLLIGSLLVLLVMCALGAAPRLLPPNSVGRFTIVTTHVYQNAYVLDTVTGQVWERESRSSEEFFAPKLKVRAAEEPNVPKPKTREGQRSGKSNPQ